MASISCHPSRFSLKEWRDCGRNSKGRMKSGKYLFCSTTRQLLRHHCSVSSGRIVTNKRRPSELRACQKPRSDELQRQPLSRKGLNRQRVKSLRSIIIVKRGDFRWSDTWCDRQVTTFTELGLENLAGGAKSNLDSNPSGDVVVDLNVHKSASGFFVEGEVAYAVCRLCNRCSARYIYAVDRTFQVWLSETKDYFQHPHGVGENNDDPAVLYFPAFEETADLTQVIREIIQLNEMVKGPCSSACENIGVRRWEFGPTGSEAVNERWLPLLEAKDDGLC